MTTHNSKIGGGCCERGILLDLLPLTIMLLLVGCAQTIPQPMISTNNTLNDTVYNATPVIDEGLFDSKIPGADYAIGAAGGFKGAVENVFGDITPVLIAGIIVLIAALLNYWMPGLGWIVAFVFILAWIK